MAHWSEISEQEHMQAHVQLKAFSVSDPNEQELRSRSVQAEHHHMSTLKVLVATIDAQ